MSCIVPFLLHERNVQHYFNLLIPPYKSGIVLASDFSTYIIFASVLTYFEHFDGNQRRVGACDMIKWEGVSNESVYEG